MPIYNDHKTDTASEHPHDVVSGPPCQEVSFLAMLNHSVAIGIRLGRKQQRLEAQPLSKSAHDMSPCLYSCINGSRAIPLDGVVAANHVIMHFELSNHTARLS